MPYSLTRAQFALDALVAAGHVSQAKVDAALALFPAPAGEPEMPEPVAYFEPDNPHNSMAFAWPGSRRMARHASGLYTADQLSAYGDAMAEHARRVAPGLVLMPEEMTGAMEDAAHEAAYIWRHTEWRTAERARYAAIRAEAPPQGEPK